MCIIAVILVYPTTHIDRRESDSTENRILAVFPHIRVNGELNKNFGRQFENWLNDRFAGRSRYIHWNNIINQFLNFGRRENEQAFEGQNGWLFYKGDHSVELYQHGLPFSMDQLRHIQMNLEEQKSWLKEQNIAYSVLIAPNKEDVYGEYYAPYIMQAKRDDRVQQLQTYLEENRCRVQIVYPLNLLKEKKATNHLLYMKLDTHWSEYGAYWGYWGWMQELTKQVKSIPVLMLEQMTLKKTVKSDGDLARMLQIDTSKGENAASYVIPQPAGGWKYQTVEERKDSAGVPKFIRTVCPGKSYKIILFRDSFSNSLLPYISSTFGEVIYIWDHNLNAYADLIQKEHPDIVMHEMVSRYTDVLLQDTDNWQRRVE